MAADKQTLVTQSQLAEELALRLPALAIAQSFGTSGDPTITVGTPTAGGAFIRLVQETTAQLNGLGQAQTVYAPHVIQLVVEATLSPTTSTAMTAANFAQLLQACQSKGMGFQLYMVADGGTPNEAAITAANLIQTVDASLYFKVKSQI